MASPPHLPEILHESRQRLNEILRVDLDPLLHYGSQVRREIESGTGETLALDQLVVTPAIKTAWESRKQVDWEHGQINVVSPEGLILLSLFEKAVRIRTTFAI